MYILSFIPYMCTSDSFYFLKVLKENPATHVDDETARDANKKLTDKNRTDSDIPGRPTILLFAS